MIEIKVGDTIVTWLGEIAKVTHIYKDGSIRVDGNVKGNIFGKLL